MNAKPTPAQHLPTPRWSGGSARPCLNVPDFATDCHHHIYNSRYPADPQATLVHADASVEDYQALQSRLGIARHVVVQPSLYGTDNAALLNALETFGAAARGIVVIDDTAGEEDLMNLHVRGVRGVRINTRLPGGVSFALIENLAAQIAPLGWHVQLATDPEHLANHMPVLSRLACPIVFDHMGYIGGDEASRRFGFPLIARLIDAGKAWVKLSGAYILSRSAGPNYADVVPVGRDFVRLAPERMLWGSDWPHPTVRGAKPDDAALLDLLAAFAPERAIQAGILVNNPARLYEF